MDNDERITGRVRTLTEAGLGNLSKDELLLRLARALEAVEQKDEALQQMDEALQQKDEALQQSARNTIFDDAVKGNWNFDQLMDTINRLEFPKVEFSEGLFDPQPRASSVATPKSVGAEFHLHMREFKYQMLAYPERCGWKRVSLPSSMHDFVCTTLFGGDAAAFDNTLATYGAYLGQLRDVYGYRRQNSGKVDENDHFRPTFTLWLGHLLKSISSFWEVKVKDRGTGTLSFAAHLKLKGNPAKTKVEVRGHEDVVALHNGHVKILGEYKAPFSAMWPSEDAQALLHAALSQMYAEMQGFIGKQRHTSTPTAMTETAAAIAAESSEGSIGGEKIWYVSFLTDGFALRVSLASEPSTVDDEGLPTVYTSSITSFLDPGSFTETILYMLAVTMTNTPLIDVVASSDFNEDLLHSTLPANDGPGGDGPNGPGAGGSSHRSPSDPIRSPHHAVDEGGDDDCGLCYVDRFVVNWNGYDDYLQFLEAEEEEVDRLNSLLASSFAKEGRLSKYALKTLGTKSLVF